MGSNKPSVVLRQLFSSKFRAKMHNKENILKNLGVRQLKDLFNFSLILKCNESTEKNYSF